MSVCLLTGLHVPRLSLFLTTDNDAQCRFVVKNEGKALNTVRSPPHRITIKTLIIHAGPLVHSKERLRRVQSAILQEEGKPACIWQLSHRLQTGIAVCDDVVELLEVKVVVVVVMDA
jgi:hypothetical protein